MKATGIVRKVDELGRVVLPKELRNVLDIVEGTPLEVYTDHNEIILKKFERGCIFCDEASADVTYKGKDICSKCLKELKK